MTRTATATATVAACICGCGRSTKSRFAPGHDARLVSLALGQAITGVAQFPASHPLAGLDRTQLGAAIARISPALGAKFDRGLANAALYAKRGQKVVEAPVVVEPACPACGAKGDEVCKGADGRRLPKGHKARHALVAA